MAKVEQLYKPPVKATNSGLYWVNTSLKSGAGKCVAAEIVDDEVGILKLWSNSIKMHGEPGWEKSKMRPEWFTKNVLPEEVKFYNFP